MNKKIQRVTSFGLVAMMFVVSLFSFMTTVDAAETRPNQITMGTGVEITDPMYDINGTNFAIKYLSDGSLGYCMNWDRHIPNNQTLNLSRQLDGGFAYIIQNGNQTADGTANYFITQVALWWYMDDTQGTNYLSAEYKAGTESGSWFENIRDLKEAAKSHQAYVTPSLKIIVPQTTMTFNADKNVFESRAHAIVRSEGTGDVTVSLESVNGSLPVGTKVVNAETGVEQYTIARGERFKVVIPADSITNTQLINNIKVTAKTVSSVSKAYEYAPADTSYYQHVMPAALYPETTDLSDSVTLTATATRVKISKQDITTKNELPGATLVVKDSSGKQVDKWVSTNTPHYIENLPAGTYTLTETIAPKGYARSKKTVTFKVLEDGKIQSAVMTNTPTKVEISKQDITNEKELPGATLVITDKDGKEVERWVSEDKPHMIEKLPVGDYTLTELIAPEGYVLSEEAVKFSVTDEEGLISVVMKNVPETPVPQTSAGMMILYIIGGLTLVGGSGMVYFNVRPRKN